MVAALHSSISEHLKLAHFPDEDPRYHSRISEPQQTPVWFCAGRFPDMQSLVLKDQHSAGQKQRKEAEFSQLKT